MWIPGPDESRGVEHTGHPHADKRDERSPGHMPNHNPRSILFWTKFNNVYLTSPGKEIRSLRGKNHMEQQEVSDRRYQPTWFTTTANTKLLIF